MTCYHIHMHHRDHYIGTGGSVFRRHPVCYATQAEGEDARQSIEGYRRVDGRPAGIVVPCRPDCGCCDRAGERV